MSPSGWIPKVWLPFALLRSYKQRAMAVTTLGFLFSCDGSHPVDPSADRSDLFDGKAAAQPITGPSSLAAVAASETRIDLTWVDNSSNESGFELDRSTTGETGTFEVRSLPSPRTRQPTRRRPRNPALSTASRFGRNGERE